MDCTEQPFHAAILGQWQHTERTGDGKEDLGAKGREKGGQGSAVRRAERILE